MKNKTNTKNEFLATYLKKNEVHLEYFIEDLIDYELSSPKIHKQFHKIYEKNFVSRKEIYETQIPRIFSAFYNYKINWVKAQFYSRNPRLNRVILPTRIFFQGTEKNIERLINNMKKKFRLESY